MSSVLAVNEMETNIQDVLSIQVSVTKVDQRTKCEEPKGIYFSLLGKAQGLVIRELRYSSSLVPALILSA